MFACDAIVVSIGWEKLISHSVAEDLVTNGKLHGITGVANSLEAPGLRCVAAPTLHPSHVKLAIVRRESTAVDAGKKLTGKRNVHALNLTINFVLQC